MPRVFLCQEMKGPVMTHDPEVSFSVCMWPRGKHSYTVYGCDIGPEVIDEIDSFGDGRATLNRRLGSGNFTVHYGESLEERDIQQAEHQVFELIATKCCAEDAVITVVHQRFTETMLVPELVSSAAAVVVDGKFTYVTQAVESPGTGLAPVPEIDEDLTWDLLNRYGSGLNQE